MLSKEDLQLVDLVDELADQLGRTINIVTKQQEVIQSLQSRVAKLEEEN